MGQLLPIASVAFGDGLGAGTQPASIARARAIEPSPRITTNRRFEVPMRRPAPQSALVNVTRASRRVCMIEIITVPDGLVVARTRLPMQIVAGCSAAFAEATAEAPLSVRANAE